MRKLKLLYYIAFQTKRGCQVATRGKGGKVKLAADRGYQKDAPHQAILMQSKPNPKVATPAPKPCKVL